MTKNRLTAICSVIYPLIFSICAVLGSVFEIPQVTVPFAFIACFLQLLALFFGKDETVLVPVLFSFSTLGLASALSDPLKWAVLGISAVSFTVFLARLFLKSDFRKSFPKKGLLFWGLAFFSVSLAANGLFSKAWSLKLLLLGGIFALLIMFVYHLTLTVGERSPRLTSYVCYASALAAIPTAVLVSKDSSLSISFAIPELSPFTASPIFGSGLGSFMNNSGGFFINLLLSTGILGVFAFLVHLKHLLEVAIRRFSVKKLLLLPVPILIIFIPWQSSDIVLVLFITVIYCVFSALAEDMLAKARQAAINNLKPIPKDRPPRVVFPFIEAGKGHITPTRAVCDVFKRKYGDKVEVIESAFYTETNDEKLEMTEKLFAAGVRTQNKNHVLSLLCRLGNFIAGDVFAQYVLMAMTASGTQSRKPAVKHLRELDADLIFTAHWSIPFYINHANRSLGNDLPHPYTVMFCPDVHSNGMFNMDCNHFLMPMRSGLKKASRTRMYAGGKLSKVPFPIRNQAFDYEGRRDEFRDAYRIDRKEFVVTLCDGGYGMANLEKTVSYLLEANEKMTIIALCGTNTALFEKMKLIKAPENITLMPISFTDKVLEYLVMSDLFVGKSGANSMAEPAFFGVPIIITKCITYIERHIKDYYVHDLGGAIHIPSSKLAAKKIISFAKHPEELDKYKEALKVFRQECGAEAMADLLYEELTKLTK